MRSPSSDEGDGTTEDPLFQSAIYRETVSHASDASSVLGPTLTLVKEEDSPSLPKERPPPFYPTRRSSYSPRIPRLQAAGNAARRAKTLRIEVPGHGNAHDRKHGGKEEKFVPVPPNVDQEYLDLQKQLLEEFYEKKAEEKREEEGVDFSDR